MGKTQAIPSAKCRKAVRKCWPTQLSAGSRLASSLGQVSIGQCKSSTSAAQRERQHSRLKTYCRDMQAPTVHLILFEWIGNRLSHLITRRTTARVPVVKSHKGVPPEQVGGVELCLQAPQGRQVVGAANLSLHILI